MTERGSHQCLSLSEEWTSRGWSQALLSGANKSTRGRREGDEQEVPPEYENEHPYCPSDEAQEQIAQKGCAVSVSGDIQEPSACNSVRALGG